MENFGQKVLKEYLDLTHMPPGGNCVMRSVGESPYRPCPGRIANPTVPECKWKSFLFEPIFNVLFCDNFHDQEIKFAIGLARSVRPVSADIVK